MSNSFFSVIKKMTTLLDPRKTKIITLPSYPDSQVELYDSLLVSEVSAIKKGESDYDIGIQILQYLIKSWSFVDEKNQPLPVNKENIGKLPLQDFNTLMNAVNEIMNFLGKSGTKN